MKKILRYVNAFIFLVALGISFMGLINVGGWMKMSLIDMLKMCVSQMNPNSVASYIGVGEEMTIFLIIAAVFFAVILLGAVLAAFLPVTGAYIASIILALMAAADISIICFGFSQAAPIEMLVWVLWLACFGAIVLLSIIGLACKDKNKMNNMSVRQKGIMAEEFNPRRNPWEMQPNIQPAPMPDVQPVPISNVQQQPIEPMPNVQGFYGAIVGKSGAYAGMAYPLEEKKQVFFMWENGKAVLSNTQGPGVIAGVYYINERMEYSVNVFEAGSVFLAGGQPLGTGQEYYLPRGTQFYVQNQSDLFELA